MNAARIGTDTDYRRSRKVAFCISGESCVKCGAVAVEGHHVYGPLDNQPDHIRPLCYWCHLVAPTGDAYWTWQQAGESGPERFTREVRRRVLAANPEVHANDIDTAIRVFAAFKGMGMKGLWF